MLQKIFVSGVNDTVIGVSDGAGGVSAVSDDVSDDIIAGVSNVISDCISGVSDVKIFFKKYFLRLLLSS